MRLTTDAQRCFDWSVASSATVVVEYEAKCNQTTAVLETNPLSVDSDAAGQACFNRNRLCK